MFVLNYICSAGIGRTGVLITMETALSQLDQGQPVSPLDIVKTLRDQRAMMVQTTVQRQNKDLYSVIVLCLINLLILRFYYYDNLYLKRFSSCFLFFCLFIGCWTVDSLKGVHSTFSHISIQFILEELLKVEHTVVL